MKNKIKYITGLVLILLLVVGLYYKQQTNKPDKNIIHLHKLISFPQKQTLDKNSIKIAVASILSPEATIESYKPLIGYIGRKMGKTAILIQRKTYQEINKLIENDSVSLGFICTGAYLYGNKDKMQILAIPQINGKTTYQAYIIVRKSSHINSFLSLKGKRFAFTDPISNTGHIYPLYLLKKMGKTPTSFFEKTIFTYSHNRSIKAVYSGIVDAASVDSIVYTDYAKRHPDVVKSLSVIKKSDQFPIPPVVVPKKLNRDLKTRLRDILINIDRSGTGRKILKNIGVDRFILPKMNIYYKFIKKYR